MFDRGYRSQTLFGVRREDDLALILEDDSKVVIAADAVVGVVGYLRYMQQDPAEALAADEALLV